MGDLPGACVPPRISAYHIPRTAILSPEREPSSLTRASLSSSNVGVGNEAKPGRICRIEIEDKVCGFICANKNEKTWRNIKSEDKLEIT